MKFKQWEKVEVFWEDSIHDSGWQRVLDYTEQQVTDDQLDQSTIGYFLHESKKAFAVVQSRGFVSYKPNNESIDSIMCIPKKAITKVVKLNEA